MSFGLHFQAVCIKFPSFLIFSTISFQSSILIAVYRFSALLTSDIYMFLISRDILHQFLRHIQALSHLQFTAVPTPVLRYRGCSERKVFTADLKTYRLKQTKAVMRSLNYSRHLTVIGMLFTLQMVSLRTMIMVLYRATLTSFSRNFHPQTTSSSRMACLYSPTVSKSIYIYIPTAKKSQSPSFSSS